MESITKLNIVDEMLLKKMSGGGEGKVEEDLFQFFLIEIAQSGGDIKSTGYVYQPSDDTLPLFTVNNVSSGWTLSYQLTANKQQKIKLKGKVTCAKWQSGRSTCSIKHNNNVILSVVQTSNETIFREVDEIISLNVGDTITFTRSGNFTNFSGVFSIS